MTTRRIGGASRPVTSELTRIDPPRTRGVRQRPGHPRMAAGFQRALNAGRSTEWRPVRDHTLHQPFTPGEIGEVDIPLMPSGTTFRAGVTLRLVVQSWSTPGQRKGGETRQWATTQAGHGRLHTSPEHRARLLIPVLGAEP